MKRLIGLLLFLAIFSLGCGLSTSGPSEKDLKSTVDAAIAQTQSAQPAATKPPVKKPAPTQEVAPTQESAPTDAPVSTSCTLPDLTTSSSGFITKVTLAKDTKGVNKDPVNPSQVFTGDATVHAVVTIKNAPNNTVFKAVWYASDTNGAADCNTLIGQYEVPTNGSRNIDFDVVPKATWPAGTYRAEIYVNDTLDTVAIYTVK